MTLTADLNAAATRPLSALLREATAEQHSRAESTSFVTALMRGELTRASYIDLTRQHVEIYRALEAAGDQLAGDEQATPFLHPGLARTASLEADLTVLAGPDWQESLEVLAATDTYTARLGEVAARWSGYYLAHAYTRYLGDLSGGQVVRTMMQRHYDMGDHELSFYRFAQIPKAKPFKDAYRAAMDANGYTAAEKAEIARESRVAFDLNTALFDALAERHCP